MAMKRMIKSLHGEYYKKVIGISSGLIAYWPLWETSGTTINDVSGKRRNGTSTGFDLNYPGIGDGRSAPNLDGVSDYGNVYSTGFASDFNGQEFTISLWAKVANSGVWADGTNRRAIFLQADANNSVRFTKGTSANNLSWAYTASGTTKSVSKSSVSSLGWLHLAITVSKSGDQLKAYYNGVQEGATMTGLGTFAGSLSSTITVIGAGNTTPNNIWSGSLAHIAIWTTILSASAIATLARVN